MTSFKSAARKLSHNSTIPALGGNKDFRVKVLQDLIVAEKAILQTLQKLSQEFTKSSECLKIWGKNEGEDLGDVLSASAMLFSYVATALTQFAAHEATVRQIMKAVRTQEENLEDMRRRRKALSAKADSADKKLQKMSPEHKSRTVQIKLLRTLNDQIESMDWEIILEEAKLSDLKRTSAKNWMMLKFGGLLECAEKATIVGEIGKLLIDEIPIEATGPGQPRVAYSGYKKTQSLLAEAHRCANKVVFSPQLAKEVTDMNIIEPFPSPDSVSASATDSTTLQRPIPRHSPSWISFPSPMSLGSTGHMRRHTVDSMSDVERMSGVGYDDFGVLDGRELVRESTSGASVRSSVDGFRSESLSGPSTACPRENSDHFTTFPVRTSEAHQSSPGPSYQLRDESPARGLQKSFSEPSDVNKAILDDPRTSSDGHYSPLPAYESHWEPPAGTGLPKGAAPPQTDNSQILYMHQPPEPTGPVSLSQPVSASQDVPTDVGVDSSVFESDEDGPLRLYAGDGGDVGERLLHEHANFEVDDLIPEILQDDRCEDDKDSLNAAAAQQVNRNLETQTLPISLVVTDEQTPSLHRNPLHTSFGISSSSHYGSPTAHTGSENV